MNHAKIISNWLRHSKLNKNCTILSSDMHVWIESVDLFTYPDILIICGQPQFYKQREDTVLNPVLIAEVLSESTKSYDHGDKFYFSAKSPR